MRILFVSANPEHATDLILRLQSAGHAARVAESAPDAVKCVAVERMDAVIVDCEDTGYWGYELVSDLKLHALVSNAPLPVLTLVATSEDAERSLYCGADGHCVKPANVTLLERRLQRLRLSMCRKRGPQDEGCRDCGPPCSAALQRVA